MRDYLPCAIILGKKRIKDNGLQLRYAIKPTKKAPTARVGIAVGAILPFNPPEGQARYLEHIADSAG